MRKEESTIFDIKATDIQNFANNSEAEKELPYIIESLVYATCTRAKYIKFWSRDTNNMPGPDGIVKNEIEHLIVPNGTSYWEIGTNIDVKKKANDDYCKLTKTISRDERMQSIFIFLTPRKWPNKDKWITEKKQRCEWKDVIALNSADIARWLNSSITQCLNFQETYMHHSIYGIRLLEEEWDIWSKVTEPKLPEYLFSYEIERHKKSFQDWFQNANNKNYTIAASSIMEGLAFLRCLLELPEFRHVKEKTVMFCEGADIRSLLSRRADCIPVIDNEELLDQCVNSKKSFRVIQITTTGRAADEIDAELGLLDYMTVNKFAAESGKTNIKEIAQRNGYCRSLIRRELNKNKKIPVWTKSEENIEIVRAICFLGYGSLEDKTYSDLLLSLVRPLIDKKIKLKQTIVQISTLEDNPVWVKRNQNFQLTKSTLVGLHSIIIAMQEIADSIDKEFILKIKDVVEECIAGDKVNNGVQILENTLNALLVYETQNVYRALSEYEDVHQLTSEITSKVLSYYCDKSSAISSRSIQLLSELRPEECLEWIEGIDLRCTQAINIAISALPILSKPDLYFRRIINLLVKWYSNVEDESIKDTSMELLLCLFSAIFPQTNAKLEERISIFKEAFNQNHNLGYELAIKLLKNVNAPSAVLPEAKYRCDNWKLQRTSIKYKDIYKVLDCYTTCLLTVTSKDSNKCIDCIDYLRYYNENNFSDFLSQIREHYIKLPNNLKGKLCSKIVHEVRYAKSSDDLICMRDNLRTLYIKLTSDNIFLYNLKYFLFDNVLDEIKKKQILDIRKATLIQSQDDGIDILSYIDDIDRFDFYSLGEILRNAHGFKLDAFIFKHFTKPCLSEKNFNNIIRGYARSMPDEDAKRTLHPLLGQIEPSRAVQLALLFPDSLALWKTVEILGLEVQKAYWQQHPLFSFLDYTPLVNCALTMLLKFGLAMPALFSISNNITKIPSRMLRKIFRTVSKQIYYKEESMNSLWLNLDEHMDYLYDHKVLSLLQCAFIEFRASYEVSNSEHYRFPFFSRYCAMHPMHLAKAIRLYMNYHRLDNPIYNTGHIYSKLSHLIQHSCIFIYTKDAMSWATRFINHLYIIDDDTKFYILGNLLCSGLISNIETWFSLQIADTMEHFYNPSLSNGFSHALQFSIGVTSRPIDIGAIYESAWLSSLSKLSHHFASTHPKTAIVLDNAKSCLDNESSRHDYHAFMIRHQ